MGPRRGPREKILSYRDQSGNDLEAHAAHWDGFTFSSGPWKVTVYGPFGSISVMASSEGEARRVISHAASISGIELDGGEDLEWEIRQIQSGRFGSVYPVRTKVVQTGLSVTKRSGPSGLPEVAPGMG